jgi:EAL domain-containing protein (putative c-di-GMP-specific phosphodiesterase class I)
MCLVLDILSIVLIVNKDRLPLGIVNFECKTYLVFLVLTGYMALVYGSVDVFRLSGVNNYIKLCGLAVIVDIIAIYILPINLYHEGMIVYSYGPSCIATYIGALSLIFLTLFNVTKKGKFMNQRRRKAIILWMLMWIIAAAIQFFNSRFLLVGFASAMGMVILFFELENPEANLDRKTGFFNSRAFVDYIKQKYNQEEDICGIFVMLGDARANDTLYETMDDAVFEVTEYLHRVPETKIFKTDEREYALLFSDNEKMDRAYSMIDDRFQRTWLDKRYKQEPVMIQPYYMLVPSSQLVKSSEEMLDLLKYFRIHIMDNPEKHVIVLDENTVARKRAREEMIGFINEALEEDRVEVFYQPIYSTREQKFVSAEALVRIRKSDGGIVPPGLFIPVAEETGLIAKLGERVFEKTCRFIKNNKLEQYGVEYIEVNLSVVQCENKALANMYIDIMKKYDVNPSFINLEITESASIIMKKTLIENMMALIDYGVTFSLDDFGNGESNLNYIVDMPVHIVKFDKDMTQAYFENEKAKYVLQAATDMIQGLELKIVAEGVETAEQLIELERLGIDYIQGYYFSKPVEERQYIEFLKNKNA